MKYESQATKEIEIKFVRVVLPVLFEEEDIPNNFPLRSGDMWSATIDIDTGKIRDWPAGKSAILSMKVCDSGCFYLLDANEQQVAAIEQDYVPHDVIPGEYGDYVKLMIGADGAITNWPKSPDVSRFFDKENFNDEI